jgi:ABC-2 type transport system permease protein
MQSLYAVYRKEMSHYFVSPIAYIIIGLFLILSGYFFMAFLGEIIRSAMQQGLEEMQYGGGAQAMDVPGLVIRYYFGLLGTLFLFLLPMLTMGVYSEERKRGTMELLMTSPITDLQIVLGKFLASISLVAIMLVPSAAYQIFMLSKTEPSPPWRVLLAAYIGLMLLGSSVLAIGSFLSSVTENQLIAAVLTFSAILMLWVIDIGGQNASSFVGSLLGYLSIIRHYDDFTRGVIDTSGLIYYGSLIFLGIFLTVRSLDSMRWRRA